MSVYCVQAGRSHWCARGRWETEQDYAAATQTLRVNEFAEICVFREQNASIVSREFEDIVVSDSWRDFSYCDNVWPAARRTLTTTKSQLSSAANRNAYGFEVL